MKTTENQRVKIIRDTLGFTQPEFKSVTDVSKTYISNIENEEMEVPESAKNKICSNLNISLEWFETGKGEMWKSGTDQENIERAKTLLKGIPQQANLNPWEAEAYLQVTEERNTLRDQVKQLTQALLNLSMNNGGKNAKANFKTAFDVTKGSSYIIENGSYSGANAVN